MGAWNDYLPGRWSISRFTTNDARPLVYLSNDKQWARGLERLRGSAYEVGSSRMAYPT